MKALIYFTKHAKSNIVDVISVGIDECDARRNATIHFAELKNDHCYDYIDDPSKIPLYEHGTAINYVPFDRASLAIELDVEKTLKIEQLTFTYSVNLRSNKHAIDGTVYEDPDFYVDYKIENKFCSHRSSAELYLSPEYITQQTVIKCIAKEIAHFEAIQFEQQRQREITEYLGYNEKEDLEGFRDF